MQWSRLIFLSNENIKESNPIIEILCWILPPILLSFRETINSTMSNFQRLRNCPSNSEDSGEQPPTKRHRRMHEWKRTQIFNNIDEAKLHIKNAQHFIYKSTRLGRDGRKLYYNCKINNCLRKMYLLKRSKHIKFFLGVSITSFQCQQKKLTCKFICELVFS